MEFFSQANELMRPEKRLASTINHRAVLPCRSILGSVKYVGIAILFISVTAACVNSTAQDSPQTTQHFDDSTAPIAENDRKTLLLKFKQEEDTRESIGEVVQEYADGSLLFLTPDGQLWTLRNEEILSRKDSVEEMKPLTQSEIFENLQTELPAGFALRKTKHYLIVYNTSEGYAEWVGSLFERLYRNFYNYWKRQQGITLEEPRFPLVALVFKDRTSYIEFAESEVGDAAKSMIGYYNMKTNQMVSYDLTGVNAIGRNLAPQMSNTKLINRILSEPKAERTVATIVHEAVHQIAYNSGLQVRLADNPRWLSEGLAMYFESPDLSSRSGWSMMGKVNRHNFEKFAGYLRRRPQDSLATLIISDDRLLIAQKALDAYPESWALTYFLMKTKKQAMKAYLQELATHPPLGSIDEKERIEMFQKHFGSDLTKLDRDFIRHMHQVRF